jgi:hypothetical protein
MLGDESGGQLFTVLVFVVSFTKNHMRALPSPHNTLSKPGCHASGFMITGFKRHWTAYSHIAPGSHSKGGMCGAPPPPHPRRPRHLDA